ncbi:hypothetical protein ACLKA7_004634 [Drosophila subpalustris]
MQSWQTKGDCCYGSYRYGCLDKSPATPCCGLDECNIFCCDCTCRKRKSRTQRKMCDGHGHSNARRKMEHEDNYDRHNRKKII